MPSFVFPPVCRKASGAFHPTMILIEPAIRKKFGLTVLKKRELEDFLVQAIEATPLSGEVSVLLTGDDQIRELNRDFRHKDKATDVLSFPAAQIPDIVEQSPLAGDLAISVETAAREAEARQHALALELKVLLLHGVLHLAGFDHEADTGQMARKENALRKHLGLAHGLIERTTGNGRRPVSPKGRNDKVKPAKPSATPARRGRKS